MIDSAMRRIVIACLLLLPLIAPAQQADRVVVSCAEGMALFGTNCPPTGRFIIGRNDYEAAREEARVRAHAAECAADPARADCQPQVNRFTWPQPSTPHPTAAR